MNVDAMIKHHQAVTEAITHAMSDYASAATGTSWNKACFAFEADAILCALSRAGFRIIGKDEVDPMTLQKAADTASEAYSDSCDWDYFSAADAAIVRAIRAIGRKA